MGPTSRNADDCATGVENIPGRGVGLAGNPNNWLMGFPGTRLSNAIQKITTATMAKSAASPINTGGLTGSLGTVKEDLVPRAGLALGRLIFFWGVAAICSGIELLGASGGKCSTDGGGTVAGCVSTLAGGVAVVGGTVGVDGSDENNGAGVIKVLGVNGETKTWSCFGVGAGSRIAGGGAGV